MPKNQYRPYKPSWNIELYQVLDKAMLEIQEASATRETIDMYSEIEDFAGIVFILDNIEKIIWTWCSNFVKSTGWAKKMIKEKKPKKLAEMVLSIMADEMQQDFSNYKVAKVIEGNHPNEFEQLFLYDIVDINLYQKHYIKPEYQHLYGYQEDPEEVKSKTKKCKNCNWIMSNDKTVCVRCKKNPDVLEK